MKLQSCDNCGVVIDTDKLKNIKEEIEQQIYEDGDDFDEKFMWMHGDYVPILTCPVCKHKNEWED